MATSRRILACSLIGWSCICATATAADRVITFEADVRPILKTNCFHCHGENEEPAAGLDLRLRHFIAKGGESGVGLVAGKPAESLLWNRISDDEMPPEEVKKRLTPSELQTIRLWIEQGATTKRAEPESLAPGALLVSEADRQFWAFQPVVRPEPPAVAATDRVRTPIDQFLLAKLESHQLSFAPDAALPRLVRRAYFDLIGLPPTPEQLDAVLNNPSPDAYEQLLDHLLASPHYGERWGRHWLDAAGYADSEGYTDSDIERKYAYKYRDYVIESFNRDRPLDEFIVQQLAGDELNSEADLSGVAAVDNLAATGFLRMAPDGTAAGGGDQNLARNRVIADTLQIVSTSLLGLTVACAECHHHRYDPIPQEDYYRLRAVFEPALDWKQWRTPQQRLVSLYTDADRERAKEVEQNAKAIEAERSKKQQEYIQKTFEKELAKLEESIRETVRAARDTAEKKRTDEQQKLLRDHPSVNVTAGSLYLYDKKAADDLKARQEKANQVRKQKPVEEFVRCLTEVPDREPPATFVFSRGDFEQPNTEVSPSELSVLSVSGESIPGNDPKLKSSGRRLHYARLLVNGEHPLVARVWMNRVWMHHFGRGIVSTPGDFGSLGVRPSHPELLNWLSAELVERGWSLKEMHRLIMTSTAYRQDSVRRPELEAIDTQNRLVGRMSVRRVESEILRDAMLAVSGQLLTKRFGSPIPVMANRVGQFVIGIENLNAGRPGPVIPMKGEDFRRSVYVQVRRSRPLGVLETFDTPSVDPNCVRRPSSTVTPQSLMLMNSTFTVQQAERFAARVERDVGADPAAAVHRAWRLVFGETPSEAESTVAGQFLREQSEFLAANPPSNVKKGKDGKPIYGAKQAASDALAVYCQALLSSNRFLYID
ncbi:MAG: DUF1553 domain-containing protein [Pirellulaceae bacterium]|nr:DUF1553 domain-containing protein [Pirellulaceae bacterium]MDP7019992.1 DUF1553 domain-containing protein [Pirellulaceae bacterium]